MQIVKSGGEKGQLGEMIFFLTIYTFERISPNSGLAM